MAAAIVLVHALGWAQPLVLRTAAQEGSAPKFIEWEGSVLGHCPDILRALEKVDPQIKFELATIPTSIKRLESHLKEGRVDIVCALLDTPLRNEIA